ncbi:MAG: hypothetical protein IKP58_08770, partial [Victivallales bacterium]|nr:hypothetical protein [Victivallales bacterium]
MGGGTETVTTYYYERAWVQNPIDSNSFADPNAKGNYRNVGAMKYQDNDLQAQSVSFGAFRFGPEIISKIGGRETYRFAQDFQLPPQMKALGARIEGEYVIIPFTPPAQNAATAIGQAVDALAGKADPNAAGKADPNAAGKADPNAAGKADPNAAGKAD